MCAPDCEIALQKRYCPTSADEAWYAPVRNERVHANRTTTSSTILRPNSDFLPAAPHDHQVERESAINEEPCRIQKIKRTLLLPELAVDAQRRQTRFKWGNQRSQVILFRRPPGTRRVEHLIKIGTLCGGMKCDFRQTETGTRCDLRVANAMRADGLPRYPTGDNTLSATQHLPVTGTQIRYFHQPIEITSGMFKDERHARPCTNDGGSSPSKAPDIARK